MLKDNDSNQALQLIFIRNRMTEPGRVSLKLVVVGDSAVGKTSLLCRLDTQQFPDQYMYVPMVWENFELKTTLNDGTKDVVIHCFDTCAQEDYDRLRPLFYPNTNIFIICCDLARGYSVKNVKNKWIPELEHWDAKVPILIVGTKADLRKGEKQNDTAFLELAADVGERAALGCVECSALTGEGMEEVVERVKEGGYKHVMEEERERRKAKGKKCHIM